MPRLSAFLTLSVVLHLVAGIFLFGRDAAPASMPAPLVVAQPRVVQVMLAPAPVRQPPVAAQRLAQETPAAAPKEPGKAVQPARQVAAARQASLRPAPEPVASHAPATRPASAVETPAALPPVAQLTVQQSPAASASQGSTSAAEVEVVSRQPAFRMPPQQPRYPAQARRRNQQGVVLLEVRLDALGAQREIRLLRSSGFPSLDRAALEAVAEWRFHPEVINGQGVPSRVQIPVEFALLASR